MSISPLNLGPYRYTTRRFLDETRMSKLWIASERMGMAPSEDDPPVTLKIARMTEEKFSYANQRAIENEERWLTRLRHPNIVTLRAIAEEGSSHRPVYRARSLLPGNPWFLVIDYLPGGDLKHLMDAREVLAASLSLHIAQHLSQAVEFIHEQGCIHCDLKSRNVLFRTQPASYILSAESEPILIDFGVAKDANDGSQRVTGTPAWMPPEAEASLRAGDKLSPKPDWDTYALGLILYNMVTGKAPRIGAFSSQSWERIDPDQFANDPSVVDSTALAAGLNQLIDQAVSDRPEERLTAREFTEQVRALRRANTRIPIEPVAPPQKPGGRRMLAGIGIVVVMIVLLVGLGLASGIFGPAAIPSSDNPAVTTVEADDAGGGVNDDAKDGAHDGGNDGSGGSESGEGDPGDKGVIPPDMLADDDEPTTTPQPPTSTPISTFTKTATPTATNTKRATNTPTRTPTKTRPGPTSTPLPDTATPRPTNTRRATNTPEPAVTRTVAVSGENGIYAPVNGARVGGNVTVRGAAEDARFRKWQLDLLIDGNPDQATFIGYDNDPVSGDMITFDSREYSDGRHVLRLRVVRSDSNYDEYLTTIWIDN